MRDHEINMDYLETVHMLHTSATRAIKMIDDKLEAHPGETHITVAIDGLTLLKTLIEVQDNAIRKMVEHDQNVLDSLEKLAGPTKPQEEGP